MENPRAEKVKQTAKSSPKPKSKSEKNSENDKQENGKESSEAPLLSSEQEFFVSDEKTGSKWKKIQPRLVLSDADDSEIYSVRFSQDGKLIAAGWVDGTVRVFSGNSGRLAFTLNPYPNAKTQGTVSNPPLPTTCVRFRPSNERHKTKNILVAANSDGTLRHWHVTSGKCVHVTEEDQNQIYAIDYREDADVFATTGRDSKVRVYDETTKTLISTHFGGRGDVTAGHVNRVFSLKFHPKDKNVLISAGWDNTIQVWDLRCDHAIRSIFGPHVCGDSIDVFGDNLLTGSWRPEEQLQMWDFGSGKLIDNIVWPIGMGSQPCLVYGAQFSKNGELFAAGGSGANEMRIFSTKSKKCLAEASGFKKGIYSLDFSPDSKQVVIGGAGMLRIYDTVGLN